MHIKFTFSLKIRCQLTRYAAITVFKSTILPIFDIGDTFYHSASASHLDKLRVLQNRAIRLIFNLPARENTDTYLTSLKMLPPPPPLEKTTALSAKCKVAFR